MGHHAVIVCHGDDDRHDPPIPFRSVAQAVELLSCATVVMANPTGRRAVVMCHSGDSWHDTQDPCWSVAEAAVLPSCAGEQVGDKRILQNVHLSLHHAVFSLFDKTHIAEVLRKRCI